MKTGTSQNENSSRQASTVSCNQGLTIIENPRERGKDSDSQNSSQAPVMNFGSPSWDVHLGLGWTMAEGINGVAT